jgi:hypothetical protein
MVLFKLILDRPVLDVYGKSIICDGGWNANINQKQFSSTVTKIHKSRGESGLYSEPCKLCWEQENNGRGHHGFK